MPGEYATTDLKRARLERDQAQGDLQKLESRLEEVVIRVDEREKMATFMRSQLPEAHARLTKENNPVCPMCEVPIDQALANGCGISTVTCDLEALQARILKLREDIAREGNEIADLKATRSKLKGEIDNARQRLDPAARTVIALERVLDERSTSVREAQRLVDDTDRYEGLLLERSTANTSADRTASSLEKTRESLAAHRASVAESIHYLSVWFDAVLQELVPGEIKGAVKLDGNGLTLKVDLGGERSTAAIESLKVVSFDIAALVMSIEGRTRLPGFLVHDSPREADLGLSIYRRLFDLGHRLESFGPTPLFQYIVTTTTEPPEEYCQEPWLRLTIHGGPAEERLLRVDL